MRLDGDWDDGGYMDWADREAIIRKDVRELNEMHRRKAKNYEAYERGETQNERADTECKTESGIYRTEL